MVRNRFLVVLACLCALLLMPAAAHAVTVSGTAMKDELGHTWQGCDGITPNLKVVVGTTVAGATTCNPTTGAFALTGVTIPSIGSRVVVFFDGALARGVLYTTAASSVADIVGLTPTQDRVWIRSEQAASMLDTSLVYGYDKTDDPDIPVVDVTGGSTWFELDPGMELHVDGGITFDLGSDYTSVGSTHVESTATLVLGNWTTLVMSNDGTLDCATGPGVSRPFCVEAGATVVDNNSEITYEGQTSRFVIEPGSWWRVSIYGNRGSLGIIGFAAAQSLTVANQIGIHSPITSDPWGADISASYIYIDGYHWDDNSDNTRPSWTGRSSFEITTDGGFEGGGTVDLPAADLELASTQGRVDFGPRDGIDQLADWEFRSVVLHNAGYARHAWGVAATGQTASVNSPTGTPLDTPIAVSETWCGAYGVYQLGQNGGDWGIVRYDAADGTVDTTFDDADGSPADDILVFDSGGVDVPWDIHVNECDLTVVGSAGGNWRIRQYGSDGSLNWNRTWDGSGTDEARSIIPIRGGLVVGGTGGATPGWRLRYYDNDGTFSTMLSFTNGGAEAEVRAICTPDQWWGHVYVIGRVGPPGSRDWAIRVAYGDGSGWDTFDGSSTWTWNPGGSEDEATACTASEDWIFVGGTTGTGASDDIRLRAFNLDGTAYSSWAGGTGIASISNAGDDELWALEVDRWADNITAAGRSGATGQASLWRYDADGDLDTSWGASGTIGWADQAATALFMDESSNLMVGTRLASNGGDGAIKEFDYSGAAMTSAVPGTVRVLVYNGHDGRGRLVVNDGFQVGDPADAAGAVTLVDVESYDTRVESRNVATVTAGTGAYRASSSQPLVSRSDMSILGQFWANTGDVRIESQSHRAELDVAPGTQFHDLSVVGGDKTVAFDELDPTRVRGRFSARGTSCSEPIQLGSRTPGDAWALDLAGGGTVDVQFADISDSNASTPVSNTNGRNVSGNSNWTFSSPCAGATFRAPNGLQVDGRVHPVNSNTAPLLSWFNRVGSNADRIDAEVYSSSPTNQVALWRLDGDATDEMGAWDLTPSAGIAWPAGRFGSAASSSTTFQGLDGGDLDLAGDFTIDGWVKTTLPGSYEYPDIIYKGNSAGSLVNYRLGFQKSTGELQAELSVNGGAGVAEAYTDATDVVDGGWHHVAMTWTSGRLNLFIDGELATSASPTGSSTSVADDVADGVTVGYQLGGDIDDLRILDEAATPSEIRGFHQTGRRHHDLVWDADPGDSAGMAFTSCGDFGSFTAPPCGNDVRGNLAYGGGEGTLRLDGARYWVRSRTRSTALQWSTWSDYDYWDVDQTITASVTTGSTVALGGGVATLPGTDVTGTATFQVTTTNVHGYSAYAYGPSDSWAMSDGLSGATHSIPGRGIVAVPTAWPAGSSGYFGLSVLAASGGKDTARWGAGVAATDYGNLNWGWGGASRGLLLHSRSAYDPAAQTVDLAMRVNPPANADPGQYTTTLVLTAVPNV